MTERLAVIGRKPCGCVAACDFDGTIESEKRYRDSGLTVERVTQYQAKLLVAVDCVHTALPIVEQ